MAAGGYYCHFLKLSFIRPFPLCKLPKVFLVCFTFSFLILDFFPPVLFTIIFFISVAVTVLFYMLLLMLYLSIAFYHNISP